jgi:hypothetical protein
LIFKNTFDAWKRQDILTKMSCNLCYDAGGLDGPCMRCGVRQEPKFGLLAKTAKTRITPDRKFARFKLIRETSKHGHSVYHIVDAEMSWRIINNLETHPEGETRSEVVNAILDFLNVKFPKAPRKDNT